MAAQVLETEERLVKKASSFGLKLLTSSSEVQAHLFTSSPTKLLRTQSNVENVLRTLELCEIEHADPWDDRKFIKLFMRQLGVSYPGDFLDRLKRDEVIEGYDMTHQQVFRNMRFMEVSGYSLVEISSTEWPELYDRPRAITEKMLSFCDEILWKQNRTIAFDVPEHYVREVRSEDKHTYEIKFNTLTPLFSGPNKPFGLIGSSSVRVIQSGDEKQDLAFI